MPSGFTAPYHSYEDLRRQADALLAKHHPAGTIPVPIEEIIEFQLSIDIVPIPGLHTLIETDGFITSDLKEIYVDESVYTKWPNRYRFTLAHEVGHALLHRDLFRQRRFRSVMEWREFLNSMPEKEHGWLEWHAYAFAGFVLVPKKDLVQRSEACMKMIRDEGVDISDDWDFAWSRIAAFLAKQFEVSSEVIDRRLQKDGIPALFRE